MPKKMPNYVDPKLLGLGSRTTIEAIDQNTLAIVINRKSRIIMADGRKILAKASRIKEAKPGWNVQLKVSAPLCGKTRKYLADHGIEVVELKL